MCLRRQVLKKWLSYRELELLGRALTPDEVREFRDIARRIVAILLLEPHLNRNYEAIKRGVYSWSNAKGQNSNRLDIGRS